VQDAKRTIEAGCGDCDDKVTLLCSLLAVAGFVSRFVAGGPSEDDFAHVWCEVLLDFSTGEWVALDPTNEKANPGWYQPFPVMITYEIFS